MTLCQTTATRIISTIFVVVFVVITIQYIFGLLLFSQITQNALRLSMENICEWNENNFRFIECNDYEGIVHNIPPYLVSFQGSGNTFTRLIIELITGYWTGSALPRDIFLVQAGFNGDKHCDDTTIVIKTHVKYKYVPRILLYYFES